jgi:hypothetical protein
MWSWKLLNGPPGINGGCEEQRVVVVVREEVNIISSIMRSETSDETNSNYDYEKVLQRIKRAYVFNSINGSHSCPERGFNHF